MELRDIKKGMKYSVVVVSYNTITDLSACVNAIFRHTEDFELIIVDNGSKDGSGAYSEDLSVRKPNVKYIMNKENLNFGPANNQGVAVAEGEKIILLNSDTLVTPKWAERLAEIMDKKERCAMVGPVSNSSNGRQVIDPKIEIGSDLEIFAAEYAQDHNEDIWEAGIMYGWCIMINRDFLKNEPYLFDEEFINSYEDDDLSVRARLKGWHLWVDGGTFIYHKGQASFRNNWKDEFMDKYMENGRRNQDLFYEKHKAKTEQKLVAVYRIANCEKYIKESLTRTSKFADEIICLFPRSSDKTKEIALSFPKVVQYQEWDCPFDEQKERNWLLQQAIKRGADWIISIDGDEVYEDKFADNIKMYMESSNPHIMAYWCNWRTIWEKEYAKDGQTVIKESFRADSTFGSFQNYRFFKVLPGMEIKKNNNLYNHHCGSAPYLPVENVGWLNVRVKHLGYDTQEQRQEKYDFYSKADPHPIQKDVGFNDYRHLIDKDVKLKTYRDENRLTVMIVCLNEEKYIYNMLENVSQIADEYVIVDTGSTDKTLAEIERFKRIYKKPVHVYADEKFEKNKDGMMLNYSEVKNFAKSKCQTEWILNMDCDELFDPREVCNIFALIDEDCDAILFKAVNYLEPPKDPDPEKNVFTLSESTRLYRNRDDIYYSGLVHESLEDSLNARTKKIGLNVLLSPFPFHHRGYLKGKDKIKEKTERYCEINDKQFALSGNQDPRALFSMAMHFMDNDDEERALFCYMESIKLAPDFWRSKQNMAYYYIEKAKTLLNEATKEMPEMMKSKDLNEILQALNSKDFKQKRLFNGKRPNSKGTGNNR